MRFIRKAGAPAEKSPKRLYVEPAELARKLVKEMDDHVVEKGDRLVARGRYTIYLCPEDYENLLPQSRDMAAELAGKLARHADSMEYFLAGQPMVEFVLDQELELGYFGILAQKGGDAARPVPPGVMPEAAPETAPQNAVPAVLGGPVAPAPAAEVLAPQAVVRDQHEVVLPAGQAAAAAAAEAVSAQPQAAQPPLSAQSPTEAIPAAVADEMGLEGRVIMITTGEQMMQFRQNRVIIGRSKEADLRVNDPNVSRKHAAVYWNNGRLMIDDLGSTNGTMVNGYPVTRTMLRPTDVVAIGESRLTVEGR
jgi:hypothetical protein